SSGAAYVIFGATGVFALAFAGYMRWINLSTAARRVRFVDPEEPSAPEVSPPEKARKRKTTRKKSAVRPTDDVPATREPDAAPLAALAQGPTALDKDGIAAVLALIRFG